MRFRVPAILFVTFMLACKAKDSTPAGIENDLKKTMQAYLYNERNNDSSKLQYRVQDVIYFEDKDKYICEFTVNLKVKLVDTTGMTKNKLFDTTGIMKANIFKDFKKVVRLY